MKRFFVALIFLCSTLWALPLVASTDTIVLTVRNGDNLHAYSLSELQNLPQQTIETSTIWTKGTQVFIGVSLQRLLADAGIASGQLEAAAVNDYAVQIPISDATEDGPIIAYMRNGSLMSLREKGPLWVVYPYDSDVKYRSESVYSRSIWQLDRITVKE